MGSSRQRGTGLAIWKRNQSERTREKLSAALDRFESGKLINLPSGQRLSRLSFAKEAVVAEDTPFSRYRPGHPKAGEYRFPDVVSRFEVLRKRVSRRKVDLSLRKRITELGTTIKQLEKRLEANRRVVNAQDFKISELESRARDLEELYSQASRERDSLQKEIRRLLGPTDD